MFSELFQDVVSVHIGYQTDVYLRDRLSGEHGLESGANIPTDHAIDVDEGTHDKTLQKIPTL